MQMVAMVAKSKYTFVKIILISSLRQTGTFKEVLEAKQVVMECLARTA